MRGKCYFCTFIGNICISINFDDIKGLGKFIEVELIGEDPESLRKKIILFVKEKLGITEDSIIEKGYVKLMLNE